jgi:HD-GYP domain-containing protein (c-di-GMP phosphodiesterase class II)
VPQIASVDFTLTSHSMMRTYLAAVAQVSELSRMHAAEIPAFLPLPAEAPGPDLAVAALLAAMDVRNPGTSGHAERVGELALELTARVQPELAAAVGLGHAFLLHDIGKIGIPDKILLKPGPLTAKERRVVETHPSLGLQIVRRLRFLSPLVGDVVGCHHEHWDGGGYPNGLGGWAIPLAARIFAVVDAFDAMTHTRPYREAMPKQDAIAEIERYAGTQFDPCVVTAFLGLLGTPSEVAATQQT